MPDSVGLYPDNPVTQMGYQIGKVDAIEPAGDHVVVSFTLETDRAFPADVKAITRSKSLLADRSLELVGNYSDGPTLHEGECIALERSYTPQSISQIAGSAADFIDAMTPANGPDDFERAIRGFDESLRGTGDTAQQMMNHASQAALSPDQTIADIGSSIQNMGPLTEEALQRWGTLRSIFDQMPAVLEAGVDLWPGPEKVAIGTGWLVATLYDIQRNYGADIWPFAQGPVVDVIHLAATRSDDFASLLGTIPAIAGLIQQQNAESGAFMIDYQPPNVLVDVLGSQGGS